MLRVGGYYPTMSWRSPRRGQAEEERPVRERLSRLVLASALPSAVFAGCALAAGYWLVWGTIESTLTATAAAVSSAVDNRLLRVQSGLVGFAMMQTIDPGTAAQLRRDALAFQQAVGSINIVVVGQDGVQVLNTSVTQGMPLPREGPNSYREAAILSGKPVIFDLFKGPATGTWLTAIAVPVRSSTPAKFVMGASLTPDHLLDVLLLQHLPKGWIAAVLDSRGVIAARTPDNGLIGSNASSSLRAALQRSSYGVERTTTLDGVAAWTAFHRSPETGWSVAIGIPVDQLLVPLSQTIGGLAAAGIATLALSLLLARKLAQKVSRSMTDLSELARTVGQDTGRTTPQLAFREAVVVATVLAESARNLKAAMAEVDRNRAQLLAIIQTAKDAVIVLGADRRIEVFNQAAISMFRYALPDVMGQPLDMLLPGWQAESPPMKEPDRSSLEARPDQIGQSAGRAMNGRRRHGQEFPLEASISQGLSGGQPFVTLILRDVTAEVRIRQELLRSNSDLQEFAAVASHDMRSPLRTIDGFLSVLDQAPDMPAARQKDLIQRCLGGVRQLDHLTERLLSFARLNATPVVFEWVDMAQAARQALDVLQQAIAEVEALIEVSLLPRVRGVHGELVQLIQNLVDNALKYRRPGHSVHIRIEVAAVSEGWLFSVSDNGIGIAPQHHADVFRMFQRLHTQQEYSGSGVGLAICARIVSRHLGRIWVESAEGGGSRFSFILPARNEET
jgi:PAS domain S-box-containing protein